MPVLGKVILRVLGVALAVSSLAYVGWFAYLGLKSGINLADVRLLPLFSSIIVQLTVLALAPLLWEHLVEVFCAPMDLRRQLVSDRFALHKSFSRSWLARYVPGRIWMIGGRVLLASRLGIPMDALAYSMFYEFVFSYSMLAVVGATLMISVTVNPLAGLFVLVVGSTSIAAAILLAQRVIGNRIPGPSANQGGRFRSLVGRMLTGTTRLTRPQVSWGVVAYGGYASLQLIFIVLVAESLVDISVRQAFAIAGVWALSGVLGYLAFFASAGGLGVRDGLALVLLSHFLDPSIGALVIAIARLIMIPADVAFVGGIELLAKANTFKNRLVAQRLKVG